MVVVVGSVVCSPRTHDDIIPQSKNIYMEIHLEKASIHNDNNPPGPVDGFSCHISDRSWSTKYSKALKSPSFFNSCCDFPKFPGVKYTPGAR